MAQTSIPADENGPVAVSVVCRRCGYIIKPDDLKVPARVERLDGKWGLQYDHDGECPAAMATRWNDRHAQTTTVKRGR